MKHFTTTSAFSFIATMETNVEAKEAKMNQIYQTEFFIANFFNIFNTHNLCTTGLLAYEHLLKPDASSF